MIPTKSYHPNSFDNLNYFRLEKSRGVLFRKLPIPKTPHNENYSKTNSFLLLSDTSGKQYKKLSKKFNKALAKKIHLIPMPKYIWVADCYIAGILIFQIIFDATDVATGMFGLYAYFQKDEIKTQLNQFLTANPKSANFFYHDSKQQFYDFLITESSV